jgi:SAM-dependent methyltransferase
MSVNNVDINPLNTSKGWDKRYNDNSFLIAGGTFTHSIEGNVLFYKTKFKAIDRCVNKIHSTLNNAVILDAAGGAGNFTEYFLNKQCKKLVVSDFSKIGLERINEKYKGDDRVSTQLFDLTNKDCPWKEEFDFIFVMEAIFLLPDEEAFGQAIKNLSFALKKGGYLIISDLYPKQTIKINAYVTYRSEDIYDTCLKKNNLGELATVRQTVLFNRRLFGAYQAKIERKGNLLYLLDQIALKMGLHSPKDQDIKYLISVKG